MRTIYAARATVRRWGALAMASTGCCLARGTSGVRAGRPRAAAAAPGAHATRLAARCSAGTQEKLKPDWAGTDKLLSKAVNAAINTKPVFALMKYMARDTLIKTAEKNGIPWRAEADALAADPEVKAAKERLEDAGVAAAYPEYYLQEFHAYDEGNLNWKAASEAASATYSMALRVWPEEDLTPEGAQARLRNSWLDALRAYLTDEQRAGDNLVAWEGVRRVLDVGCSVGISTRALADAFPSALVTGVDLSPHFLAVAATRGEAACNERVDWLHAKAESMPVEAGSVDVVSFAFVFHELPTIPAQEILREARRVLRPGGVVVLTDNNPKSEVIQNLPPALFTLMKSTEPWTDQYYVLDLEQEMRDAGFADVVTVGSDPRHRTVMACAA